MRVWAIFRWIKEEKTLPYYYHHSFILSRFFWFFFVEQKNRITKVHNQVRKKWPVTEKTNKHLWFINVNFRLYFGNVYLCAKEKKTKNQIQIKTWTLYRLIWRFWKVNGLLLFFFFLVNNKKIFLKKRLMNYVAYGS